VSENHPVTEDRATTNNPMAMRIDGRRSDASGIYGTIVAASVLASSAANDSLAQVVVLLVVTLLVYWAAEQYAHALSHSLAGHRITRAQVMLGLREGWPMVKASYLPVGVLIGSWLLGLTRTQSSSLAMGACILVLIVLGYRGAAAQGLHLRGRIMSTTIAAGLGLVLAALKYWLH
jgi:hypothetical protein